MHDVGFSQKRINEIKTIFEKNPERALRIGQEQITKAENHVILQQRLADRKAKKKAKAKPKRRSLEKKPTWAKVLVQHKKLDSMFSGKMRNRFSKPSRKMFLENPDYSLLLIPDSWIRESKKKGKYTDNNKRQYKIIRRHKGEWYETGKKRTLKQIFQKNSENFIESFPR